MKKLINDPGRVVEELIDGLVAAHPGLARLAGHPVTVRSDMEAVRNQHVTVISGGGSGHEPAHAGFVGCGMLSAAVAGEVFTSPSPASILAAIKSVAGENGVLLIVKNYTGDRLSFGLAAEMAKADGILIETVVVADDVALAQTHDRAEARGLAGTVLVHKVAGAAASAGKSLSEVARIAGETATAIATMGVALSSGTVPALGKPGFSLGETEVEFGLGIHGEPGVQRETLQSADAITDRLIDAIVSAHGLLPREEVALLINNLGATTNMELAIIARRALANLESREIAVERVLVGTFMSSLEMAGISLSILRLNGERLPLLDAPTNAPAWPRVSRHAPSSLRARTVTAPLAAHESAPPIPAGGEEVTKLRSAIQSACQALIGARDRLAELDAVGGDGDLGVTLARGANAVLQELDGYRLDNSGETLRSLGHTLQRVLGGSSGPLYGVLFLRAGSLLRATAHDDVAAWAKACLEACDAISELGGARPGDRTMLDALLPFANRLEAEAGAGATLEKALRESLAAAEQGAAATADMIGRRGRASYLGTRTLGHPDGERRLWLSGFELLFQISCAIVHRRLTDEDYNAAGLLAS